MASTVMEGGPVFLSGAQTLARPALRRWRRRPGRGVAAHRRLLRVARGGGDGRRAALGSTLELADARFLPSGSTWELADARFLPFGSTWELADARFLPSGSTLELADARFLPSGSTLELADARFLPSGSIWKLDYAPGCQKGPCPVGRPVVFSVGPRWPERSPRPTESGWPTARRFTRPAPSPTLRIRGFTGTRRAGGRRRGQQRGVDCGLQGPNGKRSVTCPWRRLLLRP